MTLLGINYFEKKPGRIPQFHVFEFALYGYENDGKDRGVLRIVIFNIGFAISI